MGDGKDANDVQFDIGQPVCYDISHQFYNK